MRILFVGPSLEKNSGPSVFSKGLISELRNNHDVFYVSKSNLTHLFKVDVNNFDIVFLNSTNLIPLFYFVYNIIFFKKKSNIVSIFHGVMGVELNPGIKKIMLRFTEFVMLRFSKKLIFVSEMFLNDFLHSKSQYLKDKSLVIPNHIDIKLINKYKVLGKKEKFIVYAGGNRLEKGFDIVSSLLKNSDGMRLSGYKIYVIGCNRCDFPDAPQDVIFSNVLNHDSFISLLSKTEIFLSTSRYETFGIGLIEAFMLNCKIVTYSKVGALDYLESKEGVFIVNHMECSEFLNGIYSAMSSTDPINRCVDSEIFSVKNVSEKYLSSLSISVGK